VTGAGLAEGDAALRNAMSDEQRIGMAIAARGRTIAVLAVGILLPFLNPSWEVLYYEALLVVFLAFGWIRQAIARRGVRIPELWLVLPELVLLTVVAALPSPFLAEDVPTAFAFRFDNFAYFYLILALSALAYSWRTIRTIAIAVIVLWLGAVTLVALFGHRVPGLRVAAESAFGQYPRLMDFFDPNKVQLTLRVQEVVVFSLVAAILALKAWRTDVLVARQAELAGERANLSRYFPPNLVDALASRQSGLSRPRTREIAVLFADIVGFTEIAERRSQDEVMALLRAYYAEIERIVFENGGTLDKYLGDGVMATFGTVEPDPGDAPGAVRAAKEIVAAIDALGPPAKGIRVSVGVHFGMATIGNVGPARRLEFAVIGDTVNVAKRLETATRDLGCRIVVSDALVQRIRAGAAPAGPVLDGFSPRAALMLRGRATPINVWVWGRAAA
jgi:adenylate cyclase